MATPRSTRDLSDSVTCSEEYVVTHPTIRENADGSLSFEARVIVHMGDGKRSWRMDKVIRCRAAKEED